MLTRALMLACAPIMGCTLLLGCRGAGDVQTLADEEALEVVEHALVDASWMVETAPAAVMAPLAGAATWQAFFKRDYVEALAAAQGPSAGRVHAEMAALYRQALLAQAWSIIETYKADQRREGDPAEVDYVLGVSYLIVGEAEQGRALIEAARGSDYAPIAKAAAAWVARLGAEGGWLVLSEDPALFPLPPVAAGVVPELPAEAHYEVPETVGEELVKLSDPSALLQAALWHEAAAAAAGGGPMAASLLAPWRLPCEAQVAPPASDLPVEALFLGGWSSDADLAFVGALSAGQDPASAMSSFAGSSAYAALIQSCSEAGAVDVDCTLDGAVKLARQVEFRMEISAGEVLADHRVMLDFVRTGALQAASRVAYAQGSERDGGVLRLNARDRALDLAADPVFLVSVAAWDASQRNSQRALQILHGYVDSLPGLQAARVSLDALHLRVSRDAGPSLPSH